MKSPDEIKKGLECCMDYQNCTEGEDPQCPYYDAQRCMEALLADALALVQQLEAERDAAVEDMHGRCPSCKHYDKDPKEEPCASCSSGYGNMDNWQWRGVQKEESEDGKE